MKKLLMKISKKYKTYGLLGIFRAVADKVPCLRRLWYEYDMKHLKKKYGYVIEKYRNFIPPKTESPDGLNGVIWTMWWQGEENLPNTVKLCLASMKKNCGGHQVILITKDNFRQYADIPEYILQKVHAGHITLTHLSDIIRASLLEKHGGLWIDATIFTSGRIPEEIFEAEYYSIKIKNEASGNQWCSFFWGHAHSKNLLASFIREMFLEYFKTHDKLFNYFFLDFAIRIAFNEIPAFHEECSRMPYNNSRVFELSKYLNSEWDAEDFAELCREQTFHKLSWKQNVDRRRASGGETFYGHLMTEYGID